MGLKRYVSQEIERGAELMKISLDELITDTILAMRSCEDKYNAI